MTTIKTELEFDVKNLKAPTKADSAYTARQYINVNSKLPNGKRIRFSGWVYYYNTEVTEKAVKEDDTDYSLLAGILD